MMALLDGNPPNKKQNEKNTPSVSDNNSAEQFHSTCQKILTEIITVTNYSFRKVSRLSNIPLRTLLDLNSGLVLSPSNKTIKKLMAMYVEICYQKNKKQIDK
jgi:predicted transcriptional regulator